MSLEHAEWSAGGLVELTGGKHSKYRNAEVVGLDLANIQPEKYDPGFVGNKDRTPANLPFP